MCSALIRLSLKAGPGNDGMQSPRDLDQVRPGVNAGLPSIAHRGNREPFIITPREQPISQEKPDVVY
jgi:hypothetical protein